MDGIATRSGPTLVASALRELVSPVLLADGKRLPLSTAAAPPSAYTSEPGHGAGPDLRVELRRSDRALSDLRTELWQAQERARRLATEVRLHAATVCLLVLCCPWLPAQGCRPKAAAQGRRPRLLPTPAAHACRLHEL